MTWKAKYKLPACFILFFILTFFLIGEQLPALPTYVFGPGVGGESPCPDRLVETVGETADTSTTTVYWKGKAYLASPDVYQFVKEDCLEVMERIE